MPHFIATVEDGSSETAIGVWFPDLPGCFSAGDDLDDALRNAPEAIALYAESLAEDGRALPRPLTLTELKRDPEIARDIQDYMVALVFAPGRADAAE